MSWKELFPEENRYFENDNGILYYADNLTIMSKMSKRSIQLIYIDPPYGIGRDKEFGMPKWYSSEKDYKFCDELGMSILRRIDKRKRSNYGICAYLRFMYERLVLMKELLANDGSIYVHLDYRMVHYMKLMMDEIFGRENFRNEIVWCYRGGGTPEKDFATKHDVILRYSKSSYYVFNLDDVRIKYSEEVLASSISRYDKSYRGNKVYEGYRPHPLGKHPEDWWLIQPLMPSDRTERVNFPTQKPEKLIERIVLASSNPGDIIADFFCGSGTLAAVAEKLGRRWVCVDNYKKAVKTIRRRLEK